LNQPVIEVQNVSKMYRLGQIGTGTLAHDLNRFFAKIRGKEDPFQKIGEKNDRSTKGESQYVWALKDIHFSVGQGEVLGIIGRNGAGKSTLLKILSRTTLPTRGRINIKGRMASLLEVGTGFHPELTGRENIFQNGAILGMRKHEIKSKLDEIIAFSGVEKYVDTPVKRYSSGMYVRLAFAVAAHLDPEILVVDEVLAVGDAEFQKKCIGKMQDVSKNQGKTVLFVSHNMAAVQNLCNTALVMKNGEIILPKTDCESAIRFYHNSIVGELVKEDFSTRTDRSGNGFLQIKSIHFYDCKDMEIAGPVCGAPLRIKVNYHAKKTIKNVSIALGFNSYTGESKIIYWSELINKNYQVTEGDGNFTCVVEKFPLSSGEYLLNIFAKGENEILDWIQEAKVVEVEDGDFFNTGKNITSGYNSVLTPQNWV